MQDITNLVLLLLLAAFALERVLAAVAFLLGPEPKPDDVDAVRRRKILLFGLAGAIALAMVDKNADLRIMQRAQPGHATAWFDYALTWLVLVAGSDQVKLVVQWISGNSAAKAEPKKEVPPVRIVVDDGVSVKSVA
jgi:hypothetical protein